MQKWTEYLILDVGQVLIQSRWQIILIEAHLDPYGICSGLIGTGVDYLMSTLVFAFLLFFHWCSMLVESGCYGRPICVASNVICTVCVPSIENFFLMSL